MRTLLLVLLCSAIGAQAQTTAITNDGRRVILNDDGTWKALDAKGDAAAVDTSCGALMINGTDASGKPTTTSQLIVVSYDGGTSGLAIILSQGAKKGHLTLNLTCAGAKGCVKKYAKVNLTYRDGSHETVVSDAQENCKGDVPIGMGGTFGRKELLASLGSKEVRTIRVWLGDMFVERDLSEANSVTLMHTVRCMGK